MGDLALFDFDGTITRHDTFFGFNTFARGRTRVAAAEVRAVAAGLRHGCFDTSFLKEVFVGALWSGTPVIEYRELARRYAETLDADVFPDAVRALAWHAERSDEVYIVTASMRDWPAFWGEPRGISVIGTELEEKDGLLTGRFATPNCRGPEKVVRIRAAIDIEQVRRGGRRIFAYGNSAGDREMLALADVPVYRWKRV
ncbi:MAG: HAD-IB family phosphatase [Synergistaceae bacterium]|jgi:HAD superfamily hydrolase (TIGR01490 family)|nr:HAD-IB family phosphatase [Synergistaceae bacterium]